VTTPTARLRVGRIRYANLFPIFHMLPRVADCSQYEFHDGYPSELNRMLREGALDISPSSSIEYLRDRGRYFHLEGHSISATGPIRSILLLSRLPIEALRGQTVYATHQSETSTALLKILLWKFHCLDCAVETSAIPFEKAIETHAAYLSIGDEALTAMNIARDVIEEEARPANVRIAKIGIHAFYIYDLADLWQRATGLPFVFALWTARRDLDPAKLALVERLRLDLDRAREAALANLPAIAEAFPGPFARAEIVSFWRGITYELPGDCLQGLALFEQYLRDLSLLPPRP
jgi:chorismate dehydratase